MGFRAAIQLGDRRGLPRSGSEGGHRAHLQEPPADAGDGGQAHLQRLRDALVRPTGTARRLIRLEQNPRVGLCPCCCLAGTQQGLQRRPLLLGERDPILDACSVERGVGWDDSGQFHARTLQNPSLPVTLRVTEH